MIEAIIIIQWMQLLTRKLVRPIANIGEYIESEHVRYWKKFHRYNASTLNEMTQCQPVLYLEKNEVRSP